MQPNTVACKAADFTFFLNVITQINWEPGAD